MGIWGLGTQEFPVGELCFRQVTLLRLYTSRSLTLFGVSEFR
jgi:hypothetical protein